VNVIRLKEPSVYLSPGTCIQRVWDAYYKIEPVVLGPYPLGIWKLGTSTGLPIGCASEETLIALLQAHMDARVIKYLYIWSSCDEETFRWAALGTDRPVLTDPCRELTGMDHYRLYPTVFDASYYTNIRHMMPPMDLDLSVLPEAPAELLWGLL
jgi:hypothetical protein